MRLSVLAVTAILMSSPAAAQQAGTLSTAAAASPRSDAETTDSPLTLPVSLERIRGALVRRSAVELLKQLGDTPTFRMEIEERRRIEELLSTLDFRSGPRVPGGLYGYEQQRLAFPPTDRPLAQPYAAFSTGQLFTVAAENIAGRALAGPIGDSFRKAQRRRAQDAARQVVDAAIADYCNSKPDKGAGIQLCDEHPVDR